MKRRRLNKRQSKKMFKRGAKVKKKNYAMGYRGGIIL